MMKLQSTRAIAETIQMNEVGFTLVELSIVLVIIGLIVGGVLVGQDLIKAAQIRAQISQITNYNTAVNTFHEKYGGLPGDLLSGANYFNGCCAGQSASNGWGNGDGVIQSIQASGNFEGETGIFWYELNASGLIPDPTNLYKNYNGASIPITPNVLPSGKIQGPLVIVMNSQNSTNYWELASVTGTLGTPTAGPGLSVLQASQIDGKIDDGIPGTGNVISIGSPFNWSPATAGPYYYGDAGTGPNSYCTNSGSYNLTGSSGPNAVSCELSIKASF